MSEEYGEENEASEEYGDEESEPPEASEEKELLFLIEFLVDTLRIKPDALAEERLDPCTNIQGENCMNLTFLHFPPMNIRERDIDSDAMLGMDETVFNSGKSLVFAMTETQFEKPPPVFLDIFAYKELPHGFQKQKVTIGRAKINLAELFEIVFDKYDEKPQELPVAKSIKDNYALTNRGRKTADVGIYIRLTCLGQNIVTEFQKTDGVCDPFLFKNLESDKIYECKQAKTSEEEIVCNDPPWKQKGVPDPDDENFEQIYAEINGSAITINVEKNKRREIPKLYTVEDFCDCDFPLPPDLVEGVSDLSITPVSYSEIPDGGVGKCNNKIVFQVPPSVKLAQPDGFSKVKYFVSTCNEGTEHGHGPKDSYKIVTGKEVARPTMPNDPEKDVFQLKIIKRGRTEKGRNALELELKTPKEKIVPPSRPPYMIHRGVGPEKKKEKKKKK